ncbi:MAG TPA: TIGR01777 family oxidoreductase [Patescibacteria group bacterium]|nr:TIGR01777 family oxidoreductase [Patescibacteria group bacterium]
MKLHKFSMRTEITSPAGDVFAWLTRPGAFERLTPPWEPVRTLARTGKAPEPGSRTIFEVRVGPSWRRWEAEHTAFEAGRMFRDEQISGPFASWVHTHTVEPTGPATCALQDEIEFALPLGALGSALGAAYVRRRMERGFAYRHRIPAQDVDAHRRWSARPQRVLVSGSSGLVGRALVAYLAAGGHTPVRLVRSADAAAADPGLPTPAVVWDPAGGGAPAGELEGFDAVVHLAGENISGGRWTPRKKAGISRSRVAGTTVLADTLSRLKRPPRTLVTASAIGYYGNRGEENLVESSPRGRGFLADVCSAWEAAAAPAKTAGIRVVHLRIGVVVSPSGGALGKMLRPFRMGVGGMIGDGRQWMSWIALDDLLDVILHALAEPEMAGPVNAVAPHPVTNEEWTKILGGVLGRPTLFPMPPFAVRAAFGEMGEELLLASTRVIPERLLAARHPFRFLQVEPALRHMLGK